MNKPILVHPGETLAEAIETLNLDVKVVSAISGIPVTTIRDICEGKMNITPLIAGQLSLAFHEIPPTFWMRLQSHYDKKASMKGMDA